MEKKLGQKIRMVRELKGFSQEYMAHALGLSQRGYSKLERDETKLDWERINQISQVFEMDPMDLVSFDDNLVFHNCTQSGKANTIYNQIPEKLMAQYEERIKHLEGEVAFLRSELARR
ncbi:MAG TPA: helix-turn-helix transcriptional regulator [Flavobacteriales bacterium]|jgi:transcriptional regulator with XRE-family HTH domain|nr:helix-turn-helix transcriptional regulator [Flavobacteriales bacterium]